MRDLVVCINEKPISTAFLDKTKKLLDYMILLSLQEYAIVEQDIERITLFCRTFNWQSTVYKANDRVYFESLALALPLSDIYL